VSKEPQIFDNTITYNQKNPLIFTMVTNAKKKKKIFLGGGGEEF
jgi:hypothetical protein